MTRFFLLAPLSLVACVDTRDPIAGTQSLRVTLVSPTSPGSFDNRLPDTARSVTVDVEALDAQNATDTSFANPVRIYVNFLGTLTPYLDADPLATVTMAGGRGTQTVMLPPVFGPSTLWLDDGGAMDPTYASGASSTLWFRDPFIVDIQKPVDEMALDALSKSPLEQKQVAVRASRYGANGRLVVTSIFTQGYTVSDVNCGPGGAPPCTTEDYNHKMIFSFSAPRDERGRPVVEGQVIDGFAGGVSEFNGLTEIGFPQTFVAADERDINVARIPAPATFETTWFTNKYMFERNEAAPIAIANAKVCDLDEDYETYKQWKLDPTGAGGDCMGRRDVLNVISTGVLSTDPATFAGNTLAKVVGVLRPVNIGTFNVWIIYPRSAADVQQ